MTWEGARTDSWWDRVLQGHPVLGERGNLPAQAVHKARRASVLNIQRPSMGQGRAHQAKRFCIRIKRCGSVAAGAEPCGPRLLD